jgi:hypothetical protein
LYISSKIDFLNLGIPAKFERAASMLAMRVNEEGFVVVGNPTWLLDHSCDSPAAVVQGTGSTFFHDAAPSQS